MKQQANLLLVVLLHHEVGNCFSETPADFQWPTRRLSQTTGVFELTAVSKAFSKHVLGTEGENDETSELEPSMRCLSAHPLYAMCFYNASTLLDRTFSSRLNHEQESTARD
jgi:hypothetical protein